MLSTDQATEIARQAIINLGRYEDHILKAKTGKCPKLADAHFKTADKFYRAASQLTDLLDAEGFSIFGPHNWGG